LSTSTQANFDEKSAPTSVTGLPAIFATTHWSVVLTAGRGDTPQARNALEKLCQTYWRPLYTYARRRGHSPEDAQDLTQSFFAWLLERNWLERADQQRGRFRSFLLVTFSRFLSNEWDRLKAQKRGGAQLITLEFDAAEALCQSQLAENSTPEQSFERRWALSLLDEVMNRLAAEFTRDGKAELFARLKPCLLGERTSQPYAALAAAVGMTEGSVKVAVHRLRQRYRQILRETIADTVEKPEEIEDELRYLFAVLARR
jgi:RNA polymerase sigma-70 factor (ECF subfamily)